ncbi:MAG: hypothetical protein M1825_003034 [Sarcosagium campestre]|nr:MAG: hypothetical protein M1825_003034 [Sarcosagium campestre]
MMLQKTLFALAALKHVGTAFAAPPSGLNHRDVATYDSDNGFDDPINLIPGLNVLDTCTGSDRDRVIEAKSDVRYMAQALIEAIKTKNVNISSSPQNPFPYFFNTTQAGTTDYVKDILAAIIDAGNGEGAPDNVTCADTLNLCSPGNGTNGTTGGNSTAGTNGTVTELPAYAHRVRFDKQPGRTKEFEIVICPKFHQYLRNDPPCSPLTTDWRSGTGAKTRAYFLLHELVHAQDIAFANAAVGETEAYGDAAGHAGLGRYNADNYARAANWAYGLGLAPDYGDSTQFNGSSCLQLFQPETLPRDPELIGANY